MGIRMEQEMEMGIQGIINGTLVPSVSLRASSLTANLGGSIDFMSSVTGSGKVSYAWDF